MGNWSDKNTHLRDSWESSILGIKDGNTQWRYDFTKYLVSTTKYNNQRFFWELIPMIRFIKNKKSIAFTDADCNIFLSAPHDKVPMDNEKWEFIYYHECLHQMFETFATAEKIKENEGACNHKLLNVASDCIINEQLHNSYNMDYPTDGLITPEYIKDKYKIEYDRKKDDQYDLYMKMLDAWDKMKDDPIIQQAFDDMPEVDVNMNSEGGESVKTSKIPSSDEFKAGSKAARHAANEILQKYSNAVKKQANGKISVDDTIDSLTKAIEEIRNVLVGKPDNKKGIKEFFNTKVLSAYKFILEAEKTSINPNFSSYEQGWEYALNDVLEQAENLIQQLSSTDGGGGGGTSNPGGEINEVPENDPSEEAPFLPKVNSSGGSSDDSGDSQDDQNSDENSDSKDNDSKDKDSKDNSNKSQGKQDKNDSSDSTSDSNSDIDEMSGSAAEKDAEKSANEAQKAADEAKEAADQAREKADKTGNASDKQKADKAEAAADKAQKAADEAKQEADNAKEANESGNEEEAKSHAKSARSKASEAKSCAKDAKESSSESDSSAKDGEKNNKEADIDWDAKDRDAEINSDLIGKIKSFNEKNIGKMSPDEAKNIIRKFTSSIDKSSTLGDFVKKCHSSSTKSKDGIVVQTVMQKRNVSWGENFSNIIKNTVKQRVGKKLNDWEKTFRRPNRRQGVIHDGDIIQKGKMRKKDRLTISLAFYIDCSNSMNDNDIKKIFKFVYKLEDYLQKKYRRNPVVDGCIFDYYRFTVGIKRVIPPAIPSRGGNTDDLDVLLNRIITVAKDHMINVIITDGEMNIAPNDVKTQLGKLAGNVVYITNNTGIDPALKKIKQLCGNGAQDVGNKFEYIVTSNFDLSSSDFAQI